jgi:phage-related protein
MLTKTMEHEGYIIEIYRNGDHIIHGYVKEIVSEKALFFTRQYGIIRFYTEPIHYTKGVDSESTAIGLCMRSIKNIRR